MKIYSFFILLLALSSQANTLTVQEVEQLFLGVVSGVGGQANLTALLPCVQDSLSIGTELDGAIQFFMSKDIASVKAGLKLLGEAIQTLPDAMTQCGQARAQAEKLYQMLKTFQSPLSFAYHVGKDMLVNGVQIYQDIENLLAAYHAQNWNQVGYYAGHALAEILIGETVLRNKAKKLTLDVQIVEEIFLGVLKGIEIQANFIAIEKCISDVTSTGSEFVEAVEDFQKEDEEDVKEGLKLLGQAIELLPDAMTQCEEAVQDAKRLYEMIANFKSPWSFVYHVSEDLLVNGVQIYDYINAAVKAYQAQEWESFGYNCGYTLSLVLIGGQNPTKWQMTEHESFRNLTNEQFAQRYLGLNLLHITSELPRVDYRPLLGGAVLPTSFDSRVQWPNCIHQIRNQKLCGSCWAFAASETLSDRFCIASRGKLNSVLSPQFMVSCDTSNSGCKGGILTFAWEFLENHGIVSESCLPFHSFDGSTYPCYKFQKCEDGSPIKNFYAQKGSSKTFTDPDSIKLEIMTNGPVETGFLVYENFRNYKSGVYSKGSNPGKMLGGHAVKIIGWGQENGVKYWICANSWDVTWGEKGFFRIKIGECGIDTDAVVGLPDLKRN